MEIKANNNHINKLYDNIHKVLIIEDNESDALIVSLLLEDIPNTRYQTIHKTSLQEGIDALKEIQFDVVLLDLHLPDSFGFETLNKLLFVHPDANVIVLTGQQDKKIGTEAVSVGAQDYLVKGTFDSEWLGRALNYSIQRKRYLKRLKEAQKFAQLGHWEYIISNSTLYPSEEVSNILNIKDINPIDINDDIINNKNHFLHFFYKVIKQSHKKTINKDWEIKDKKGNNKSIYIRANSITDTKGEVIKIQGILQDITERKLKDQLQKDRDLAIESAKIKENLLANVSHEMRTPLTAVMSSCELITDMPLNDEQKELITSIQQNSSHLLVMINDILEISSQKSGKLKLENVPFNLFTILKNTYNISKVKTQGKSIDYKIETPENMPHLLVGDPNRLNQVIVNLISNAFKFTLGGSVSLKVEIVEDNEEEAHFQFSVKDTGIGIPQDKIHYIFEPFGRVENKEHNFQGTGLGLAITQNIITAQNGGIGVYSEEGKGSTFYFDLKFKKQKVTDNSDKPEVQKVDFTSQINTETKILLAEDQLSLQFTTKKILEKRNPLISVDIANNGKEAFDLFMTNNYDLIIMDIQMPVMDGFEAVEAIRKNEKDDNHIPIIIMTADALVTENERFQKNMINDYLFKPFKPNDLFEKIVINLNNKVIH